MIETNSNTNNSLPLEVIAEQQRFMVKVYGWMGAALAITGFVALFTASSEVLLDFVLGSRWNFYGLLILEFVVVIWLSNRIHAMSATTAMAVFVGYSALNGLTFSLIFLIYTASSIASTFFVTAGTFAAISIYAYTTKSDLSRWGSYLMMALFGLIIASVVNLFMNNSTLYWITSFAGVLIFVGLTAYDTQKIKNMNIIGNEGTDEDKKEAIMGALTLYLDFINLFLYLLRFMGNRK